MRDDAVLFLTGRCNLACPHCLRDGSTDIDLSMDYIDAFLDECVVEGVRTICLTGGEPMLHRDFESVMDAIAERNLFYTLVTNGRCIQPYLERLERCPDRCLSVSVSLDGATKEVHEAMRGRGFREATEAVRAFAEVGVPTSVQMLVTEVNADRVAPMVELAKELGAAALWLAAAITNPAESPILPWEGGRREARITAKQEGKRRDLPVYFASCYLRMGDLMICRNMRDPQLGINPRGEVVFCCNTWGAGAVLGPLGERTLAQYREEARVIGSHLIREKMRLNEEKRLDEYETNCIFCNAYLAERIRSLR